MKKSSRDSQQPTESPIKGWRNTIIRPDDLHYDGAQPLMPHLVALIGATMVGERQQDIRHVPVRNLETRDEDVMPEHLAMMLESPPPPPRAPLFVVEIGRRRYWAFDDTHAVRTWQQTQPDMMVAVDVLKVYTSSADNE